MTTTQNTIRPDYLPRDTYAGKWQTTRPAGNVTGSRTAAWLAEHIGDGNVAALWMFSGHTRGGRRLFTRTRYLSHGGQLYGYTAEGSLFIIHRAVRVVQFLADGANR